MAFGFYAAGCGFRRHSTERMLELIEHMIAPDLVEEARPLQEYPRTIMQFGDRKSDAAARQVGGNLAERDGPSAIQEIAGTGVQDEMPRFLRHAIDDPADAVTQIITVEEYDGTLQQVDDHAWDGFGLGVPVQFVESVMKGDFDLLSETAKRLASK